MFDNNDINDDNTTNWKATEKETVTWPQTNTKENRIESVDSMEEMQRRFEKVMRERVGVPYEKERERERG